MTKSEGGRKGGNEHRSSEYEWGGPIGAAATVIALPLLIVAFCGNCGPLGCPGNMSDFLPTGLVNEFWSLEAFAVVLCWIAVHAILYFVLPGEMASGLPLKDGNVLQYPINGT